MAGSGIGQDEQQLKRRAMRRLAIALALIAAAIVALALVDRYNATLKKAEPPAVPPGAQTAPSPSQRPPAAEAVPAVPLPGPGTPQPPPPPPVVSNEAVVPPESAHPGKPTKQAPATGLHPEQEATTKGSPPAASPAAKPAEAPVPQKPAPGAPQPGGEARGFLVQVGVFSSPENAKKLQERLAERNIPSILETRVVVGPFRDRAEADSVNRQLKEMGLQGVVVAPH